MRLGGGRTANQQRQVKIAALHFLGDVHHLVQRRGDQAGQADNVALLVDGGLQDFFRWHHYSQIDDVITVTAQDHADNILADVVYIAFYRGHQNLALGLGGVALFLFDKGDQVRYGLFHYAGGLDHLGQEHLAGAEQVADHVHAGHQRAFNDLDRALGLLAGQLGVLDDPGGDALDQ